MNYQHLTQGQRYQIARLNRAGLSCREIAAVAWGHHSTTARELKRHRVNGGYAARKAHFAAVTRRHRASSRTRIPVTTWATIEARLRDDWSPAQIVGRGIAAVSIERVYQHLAHDKHCGGSLWQHRRHRKRRHHHIGTPRQRFHGRRIAERPEHVQARKQVGHWEADSVLGNGPPRLLTFVERKSRFTRLVRVADGTAAAAHRATLASLYPLKHCVKTITYDNGSEVCRVCPDRHGA